MKEGMVFYRSWFEALEDVPAEDFKAVIMAMARLGLDGEETDLTGMAKAILTMARPTIEKNNQRYENGSKGGRKPETKEEPRNNQTASKTASDNNREETKQKPNRNRTVTKPEPNHNQTITKPEPTEDRRQNIETEDRRQKQNTEDRIQKTENRKQKTETEFSDENKNSSGLSSEEVYCPAEPPKGENGEYRMIVAYLNSKTGKSFKASNKETIAHINARKRDGFTIKDFYTVIDNKCSEWLGTEMEQYLRPETLFSPKHFESYLNQPVRAKPKSRVAVVDDW